MKQLTGKYYHKPNFWGNLVLWVEEEVGDEISWKRWRKAIFSDLLELNLTK